MQIERETIQKRHRYRFNQKFEESILQQMMQKEQNYFAWDGTAEYNSKRKEIVTHIVDICEKLRVPHQLTQFMAINVMDAYLNRMNVKPKLWQLVCLCCVTIAIKFEEQEQYVPSFRVLQAISRHQYQSMDFMKMEAEILSSMNWKVNIVGHYHFILYFMKQGCLFETDSIRGEQNKAAWRNTAQTFLVKYVDFFAIIASQQFEFTKYKPSQIGAACIAAARFVLQIRPVWVESLKNTTRYEKHDIEEPAEKLWEFFKLEYPDHTNGVTS